MRRRFGRRRWGGVGSNGRSGGGELDVARELDRVVQAGLVPAEALEPVAADEVPASLAAVGIGRSAAGEPLVVGVAPVSGGDAWLGALAAAARRMRDEGFAGAVYAISASWPLAARRRLSLLRPGLLTVRARLDAAPGTERDVAPEPPEAPVLPDVPAARGASAALFARAARALTGLAAKHGGAARPAAAGLELVLLGRAVAILRGEERGVVLEALEPRRELVPIAAESLAEAFDRLEGSLRKVLSDRRLREGAPGQRAALAERLAAVAGVAAPRPWPLPGALGDAVDFAGADADGRGVVAVAHASLGLAELGAALDGWIALAPRLPALVGARPAAGAPLLLLAAERLDAAAEAVLGCLALDARIYDAAGGALRLCGAPERLAPAAGAPAARPAAAEAAATPTPPARPEPPREEALPALAPLASPPAAPAGEPGIEPAAEEAGEAPRRRFEELSLFDLAAESEEGAGSAGRRRRRRRRGRGRGRSALAAAEADGEGEGEGDEDTGEEETEPEPVRAREEREGRGRRRRGGRGRRREGAAEAGAEPADDEDAVDEEEALVSLADVPEAEAPEVVLEAGESGYEDEEEGDDEAESPEEARLKAEREARRRARIAKAAPEVAAAPPRPPRRRAAFLAHADRESIAAAVLLARETRLVEGIWIYPQQDLMTFFRGVATDLRDDTPIYVIGFVASPARDALQAASLYRDRLTWFDHHEWPPEDLEGLRAAIGSESVHVEPGAGSVLPLVLAHCTRRSRFSDKLVDLVTGRFSRHDYERWGRLWWWRLGELASRPGERRAELDPLITGRPSDLARDAARAAPPPPPPEAEWVASRDFRLVHFGGYVLVRVPAPPEIDLHLAARIARERYGAHLSLAWCEGGEHFVLAADDTSSRRALDLSGMVEHLASKYGYVRALPDADHVAHFRIEGAARQPERIDEIVGEIAMGRTILEG